MAMIVKAETLGLRVFLQQLVLLLQGSGRRGPFCTPTPSTPNHGPWHSLLSSQSKYLSSFMCIMSLFIFPSDQPYTSVALVFMNCNRSI